ncbi:putative glucose-methanol-choline oxidoreductase [Helianthus annuus]|nr:putative glucose-methanol-choline oxidoreductase [Helianthus annuus]
MNLVLGSPSDYQGGFYCRGCPISTGEVKLRSSNPTDSPDVKFNNFKEPEDMEKCVDGIST